MSTVSALDFLRGGYYDNHMDGETFGQRLQRLRVWRKLSQRELARRAELGSHASIWKAEREEGWVGQLPSLDVLKRLANALEVEVAVLTGEADPPPEPARPEWLDATMARLLEMLGAEPYLETSIKLDQVVSAGNAGKGRGVNEEGGRYRSRRETLYVVEVEGECMVPEVESGDEVKFDPELVPEDGDWVVATIDGERAVIKEYRVKGAVQRLLPLNGEPLIMDENVRIVGVVMKVEKPAPRLRRRRR